MVKITSLSLHYFSYDAVRMYCTMMCKRRILPISQTNSCSHSNICTHSYFHYSLLVGWCYCLTERTLNVLLGTKNNTLTHTNPLFSLCWYRIINAEKHIVWDKNLQACFFFPRWVYSPPHSFPSFMKNKQTKKTTKKLPKKQTKYHLQENDFIFCCKLSVPQIKAWSLHLPMIQSYCHQSP